METLVQRHWKEKVIEVYESDILTEHKIVLMCTAKSWFIRNLNIDESKHYIDSIDSLVESLKYLLEYEKSRRKYYEVKTLRKINKRLKDVVYSIDDIEIALRHNRHKKSNFKLFKQLVINKIKNIFKHEKTNTGTNQKTQ